MCRGARVSAVGTVSPSDQLVSLLVWAPGTGTARDQPRSPRSLEGNDGVTAIGLERCILVIQSCFNFAISLLRSKQENSSISFTCKSLLVEIGL